MTKIDPKMSKIRQIDPKISKKCVSYCKNPTRDKKSGLALKILLLVPKPTGHLVPSCRNNFQLCQNVSKLNTAQLLAYHMMRKKSWCISVFAVA